MTATLLHLLRALWWAVSRGPRVAWLSYCLWELEAWMDDIARDYRANGLPDSRHLADCRAQAAEYRIRIALLQPGLRRAPHTRRTA